MYRLQQCVYANETQLSTCVGLKFKYNAIAHSKSDYRDVLAVDEPTRTCCGLLQSWVPKIKILKKIKNIDFKFENQD